MYKIDLRLPFGFCDSLQELIIIILYILDLIIIILEFVSF